MASSLLIATTVGKVLMPGPKFLIWDWEAYLDARFLTMIAALEQRERDYSDLCYEESSLRSTPNVIRVDGPGFSVFDAHEFKSGSASLMVKLRSLGGRSVDVPMFTLSAEFIALI